MMLISNNSYFYEINLDFKLRYKKEDVIHHSTLIGIYQLFRGLYFFILMFLVALNYKTLPNVYLYLFIGEIIRNSVKNKYLFFSINLIMLLYLLALLVNLK